MFKPSGGRDCSKAVVLFLVHCFLLLPFCGCFAFWPFLVMQYLMSVLVLQSFRLGKESRLLYFYCVLFLSCDCPLFCKALLIILSSFAVISLRKRESFALL